MTTTNGDKPRAKQKTNNSNLVTFRAKPALKSTLEQLEDAGVITNRTEYLNKLVKRDLERRGFTFGSLELGRRVIS